MHFCRVLGVLLILVALLQYGEAKKKKSTPDCPGMFQCNDSSCIDLNKVCNTEMDCPMNEDENNCTPPSPLRPRFCLSGAPQCFSVFVVPDESKSVVFIDEFQISNALLCQSACSVNDDCVVQIVKTTYAGSVATEMTCLVSRLTIAEIQAIENTIVTTVACPPVPPVPVNGMLFAAITPICLVNTSR